MNAFRKNLRVIKEAVSESGLSGAERKALIQMFENVPDHELLDIAELASEDPENLAVLYKNISGKCQAIREDNEEAWSDIVEDETQFLERLSKI